MQRGDDRGRTSSVIYFFGYSGCFRLLESRLIEFLLHLHTTLRDSFNRFQMHFHIYFGQSEQSANPKLVWSQLVSIIGTLLYLIFETI